MGDLKPEVIQAMSAQIHREYEAALFYRQAYHWCDLNLYPGTAKFFKGEAEEETGHAHELEEMLLQRNASFELGAITTNKQRAAAWAKPHDIFRDAYALECQYRDHIEAVAGVARAAGDELSVIKLVAFLENQVDSANEFEELEKKARSYSAMEGLYYIFDSELLKK